MTAVQKTLVHYSGRHRATKIEGDQEYMEKKDLEKKWAQKVSVTAGGRWRRQRSRELEPGWRQVSL